MDALRVVRLDVDTKTARFGQAAHIDADAVFLVTEPSVDVRQDPTPVPDQRIALAYRQRVGVQARVLRNIAGQRLEKISAGEPLGRIDVGYTVGWDVGVDYVEV